MKMGTTVRQMRRSQALRRSIKILTRIQLEKKGGVVDGEGNATISTWLSSGSPRQTQAAAATKHTNKQYKKGFIPFFYPSGYLQNAQSREKTFYINLLKKV